MRASVAVGRMGHGARNVDVLPRHPMIAELVLLVAACGLCVLADPRCLCFLWLRADYVPCETAGLWLLWFFSGVGIGPVVHESSPLFIFPKFHRSMRGVDTCLNLGVFGVSSRGELDHHCSVFNILADLRPELPDRNAIIKDSSEGKISMYTRFIEFANFWIPLSKFLLYILKYYQINLSQLSVIGAAKVSHFEIMCCALGRVPTVGTFRHLYVNCISNGWLSFSKCGGVDDPYCYSKKFDSLMNWNNHFFWIDASVCPLSIPWFSGTSAVKDPLSVDEAVDLPCVELLNENRTVIRKYLEVFLCLVGLSRSFTKTDVRPILLHNNDEEMGLLDFVNSADPFKVKTGERTLAENEVLLVTETEDRVISPSPQPISLVDHTIRDELNVNAGKRKKRVAFVSGSPPVKKAQTEGSGQANTGSGSATPATEDATSSSVTPTPEHAPEDDNVRTLPPTSRLVVLSSGSADTDIPTSLQVVPPVSLVQAGVSVPVTEPVSDGRTSSAPELEAGTLSTTPSQGSTANDFYESQTIDSATALNIYVPNWNITNNARVDNPVICRNLLDHVTPLGYWATLRNQHDA
ncbi:hypothetical protein Tco_1569901 [Tanacetum coccineum]